MDKFHRISNRFFLLGLGLVGLVVYPLLLAAIAFIRGQVMNVWIFPAAIVMTGITQYFAARAMFPEKPLKVFFQGLLFLLLISAGSLWVSGKIYDVSFDGQWYQQEMVQKIKAGWNPYLHSLEVPDEDNPEGGPLDDCAGVYGSPRSDPGPGTGFQLKYGIMNYFPKGIQVVEAAIYVLTGRIETAKAVNFLALFAAAALCLACLYRQEKIPVAKKWAIALIAALNPVTLGQLPTFCNDGTLAALFLALLAGLFLLIESTGHYRLFLVGLLLIVCINIKISALSYLLLLNGTFLVFFYRSGSRVTGKKLLYSSLLAWGVGLVFIGFHPYFTNLITGNSPFYDWNRMTSLLSRVTPSYLTGKARPEPRPGLLLFPFWLIFPAILFWLETKTNPRRATLTNILYSMSATWSLIAVGGVFVAILNSSRIGYELQQLKASHERVTIEYCPFRDFRSNALRLGEENIPYTEGTARSPNARILLFSDTRAETGASLPALPKPLLTRWAEDLLGER